MKNRVDRAAVEQARAAFLCACMLDVAVRKPGNVSVHSAGHRMQASMFIDAARAAVDPLFRVGAGVGERVEAAVEASWAAAHCNTNLGILLLCAPLAAAAERLPADPALPALRQSLADVLADLSLVDSAHAFRGIARANPGGLGDAPTEDVRAAPTIDLRSAMVLAAERDAIARQYRDGYAEVFDLAVPALGAGYVRPTAASCVSPDAATTAAVQRVYLTWLAGFPDSHIVRKHGEAVAQTVMTSAQAWRDVSATPGALADCAAWDESLKSQGLNPGTSADLTVATLMIAGMVCGWHGT